MSAKKNSKKLEEIKQIKNSLMANKDIIKNHPHLKESVEKKNIELNKHLEELEKEVKE